MAVIKVRNTSSSSVGFTDLVLKSEAIRQDNTDTNVPGKNLGFRRAAQLEKAGTGNAVQIVLSDYFTIEDIAESDGLKTEFEDGNVTIYVDGTPITNFSEIRLLLATVTGTVIVAPRDDVGLKQVVSTSYLGSAMTKSGAGSLDVISYCDVSITIAHATATGTWDTTNEIVMPATTYSGANPLELSIAEEINVGSHFGINVKTNAVPTVGKDYIIVIKTT